MKSEGETFVVGDILYEVESEKASIEVEAKAPGRVLRIVSEAGELVDVGGLLALIGEPDESTTAAEIEAAIVRTRQTPKGPPEHLNPDEGKGSVAATDGTRSRVPVMPLARRLAAEAGIDLALVTGTGTDGTITPADITGRAFPVRQVRESRPLTSIQKAMASAVVASSSIPQFVQMVLVDASALVQRREQDSHSFTYTDYLIDAVVSAVADVPEANSAFGEDFLTLFADVNVAVATSTEHGLQVPVVRRAQSMTMAERSLELRRLTDLARKGALGYADSEGATITLSNLGMHRIDGGVPLLSPGHTTLVFAGSLLKRPLVVADRVEARHSLPISIAYDHRAVDGAAAARFTECIVSRLEGGLRPDRGSE